MTRARSIHRALGPVIASLCALISASCADEKPKRAVFHAEGAPQTLAEWGVLTVGSGVLHLADGAVVYDLATPLFSDYAAKLRTVSLPAGQSAILGPDGSIDFPVGTIITKTFYYAAKDIATEAPQSEAARAHAVGVAPPLEIAGKALQLGGLRLIETRILARREAGWVALPYVWNDAQTEARLQRAGSLIPLSLTRDNAEATTFGYVTPNVNQCAGCHATDATTRALEPIGLHARHLGGPSPNAPRIDQIDALRLVGVLTVANEASAPLARNADWTDENQSIDERARAYLDINCSHCHSDKGPARTSGLDLTTDAPAGPKLGYCKPPVAAGSGTGGRRYGIAPGDPDESILVYRMETTLPGAMMPEIGRALPHDEGVDLIRAWVARLVGDSA